MKVTEISKSVCVCVCACACVCMYKKNANKEFSNNNGLQYVHVEKPVIRNSSVELRYVTHAIFIAKQGCIQKMRLGGAN